MVWSDTQTQNKHWKKRSKNKMRIEKKIKPLELMWPERVHLAQRLHRLRLDCNKAEQVASIRSFRHRIVRIFSNIESHRNRLPQSNYFLKVPHRSRRVLYSAKQSIEEFFFVRDLRITPGFFVKWNSPKSMYRLPDRIVRLCRFANSRPDC